jgi:hypothetical protein
MAKHLTPRDVTAIVGIIDGWSAEKMTWEAICDACAGAVGKRPTRQSLTSNERIRNAYTARKKGLRAAPRQILPANLKVAVERIKRLESIASRLEQENTRYRERLTVWQYNAYKRGLTEHQLNEPLPRIDRDRTEKQ